MNNRARQLATLVVALAVLVPAGLAWACVAVMSLTTNSSSVDPGGTLTVTGKGFAQNAPIEIHLDAVDGPILATAPAPESTMTSRFDLPVTLPADLAEGPHILVATQDAHHMNAGAPARASINVGTPAPAPATPVERPAALTVDDGPSWLAYALIGLGVAGVGLFVIALANLWVSRPRPAAEKAEG